MAEHNSKLKLTLTIIIILIVFAGGVLTAKLMAQRVSNLHQSLQRFSYILNLIINDYVEEVDADKLVKSAINGMLNALDPYSNFLEAEEYSELKTRLEAQFGGIGIYIGLRDNFPAVISPIEGTPAYKVGLLAGDKIVKIEGKSTEGMSIQEAMKLLRGTPGTTVKISCQREGVSNLLDFTITRDTIKIKAVPYAGKLTPQIGYVRLADFSKVARIELESAIDSLFEKEGITKLIFDLRSNPGGYLQEGYEVADLFLPPGKLVVVAKGRREESKREFITATEDKFGEYPLITLVDRGSASASEIVAGALQDWERSLILGDTTFGKGSVQNIIPIDQNTALKLTNAYWYTPSGRCINRPHQSPVIVRQDSGKMSQKKYYTLGSLRRELTGVGGIVPDYYMHYRRYNEFETKLINQAVFFDFAVKYVAQHKELKPDFQITNEMLDEFKQIVRNKKIEFTDATFDSNITFIKQEIEREIKSKLYGMKGDYEVRLKYDEQVQKAVEFLEKSNSLKDLFKVVKSQ
ncbi:MAG: S41 family peptidase [candidate division WOR-3 bacterium]